MADTVLPDHSDHVPPTQIAISALKVGALSGASGLLFGSLAGIIRSSHPVIFSVAAGLQWFALGTTFWASRGFLLNNWERASVSAKERVYASAIAGSLSGATVASITRGRSNTIPGGIMFALFGGLGQHSYNVLDASHTVEADRVALGGATLRTSLWRRVVEMKLSPMKVLTDKEYESILKEKLLRVDAELALVNEDICRREAEKVSQSQS